ncbi:MAG: hypothetical protein ACTSWW_07705 [Promethearchaeota archaeon]
MTIAQIDFRYLIPEKIFNELTALSKKGHENKNSIASGWLFADRKNNFAIIKGYEISKDPSDAHVRPKSWMRMKKHKLYTMRRFREERNIDIIYQFHTHPSGKEPLHEVDLKILNYLTTGVFVVITPDNVVGWFFDKRETKKPLIDKMIFEIINE